MSTRVRKIYRELTDVPRFWISTRLYKFDNPHGRDLMFVLDQNVTRKHNGKRVERNREVLFEDAIECEAIKWAIDLHAELVARYRDYRKMRGELGPYPIEDEAESVSQDGEA